jgi:hypothetical protein
VKLTCPACGAAISLDAVIGHEGARNAVMIALQLPAPVGKLLVQYVAMFRPASRNLSMDRLASLLGELLPMIDSARIERGGRQYLATQDYWVMGLTDVINRRGSGLTLPLKSHGYLLEVIAGYSVKAEAQAEAQREAKKGGQTPVGYVERATPAVRAPPPVQKPIPAEAVAAFNKFKRTTEPINEEGEQHD